MSNREITANVSGYEAIFEQTATGWSATVSDLSVVVASGDTLEQTKANVKEAIELWIEVAKEKGHNIPQSRMGSLIPDGYGQRTVDGLTVLANRHIDRNGVVWWHARVWRERENSPAEYWITGDEIRLGLESHYMLPDGSNSVVIGDLVQMPEHRRIAMLEAIRQLNESSLSRRLVRGITDTE